MDINVTTGSLAFLFGILSAKWAMELGYSQFTQIILFGLGLIAGPLVLFLLYMRNIEIWYSQVSDETNSKF